MKPAVLTTKGPARTIIELADFRPLVDREIKKLYSDWSTNAAAVDPQYVELVGHIGEFIGRGGKRWRPYLTYLGYAGYGGSDTAAVIPVAASQEVYHNAWLIYDDIIDRDLIRYGGPNISGRYLDEFQAHHEEADAHHLADSMALLAGNINTALATDLILTAPFPDERKVRALRLQQETIIELAGGEQLDVLLSAGEYNKVTKERLLKVCQYKAANYTFEAPLQIGAILAGASEEQIQSITDFAIPLGIAFQLADDLLGMFGDEHVTGKSTISDLREGKRTLIILEGLERADMSGRHIIRQSLGNLDATYDDLSQVRAVLEACGARQAVQDLADDQVERSLAQLDALDMDPMVAALIRKIAVATVNRNS